MKSDITTDSDTNGGNSKLVLKLSDATNKAAKEAEAAPRLPPKPVREQAKVLYNYSAQNEDELSIKEGDIIFVICKDIEDKGWWRGELNGKIGVFPDNFVELIKPEETPPRKKPNRPTDKPQTSPNSLKADFKSFLPTSNSSSSTSISKSASFSSSDSKISETKETLGSDGINDNNRTLESRSLGPNVPEKKPKPNRMSTSINSANNVTKEEKGDLNENVDDNIINLDSCESSVKLTHLTVTRSRGPKDRRPPSMISNRDNDDSEKESKDNKNFPLWMIELKKSQAEKKNKDGDMKLAGSPKSGSRLSGDFTNRFIKQEQPNSLPVEICESLSIKPMKSTKPATPISSGPSKSPIPRPTSDTIKELNDVIKEVKAIKDNICTKKEYDDLVNQVKELKDLLENQRQSYGSIIKELINEVAEERKKMATLVIEVDRLRKLTTTV